MTDSTASIKIIPFSGKKADWPVWSEKFLARAKRRGYRDHLLGIVKTPTDSEKPTASATQSDKDIYKKSREPNELAYEDLILCIDGATATGRVAFGCVKGARTSEHEFGDCTLAWRRLT